jgi:tetratricopeptide (TPR) repeat protein
VNIGIQVGKGKYDSSKIWFFVIALFVSFLAIFIIGTVEKNRSERNTGVFLLKYEDFLNRGMDYYSNGKYTTAIVVFSKAASLKPDREDAYFYRGLCYDRKNLDRSAISNYSKVIAINPDTASAYYNRGRIYQRNRNYDYAIENFTEAINTFPEYAYAYHGRGLCYRNKIFSNPSFRRDLTASFYTPDRFSCPSVRNYYESAISDFSEAINIDPFETRFYQDRGKLYRLFDKHEDAKRDFKLAESLKDK